SRQYKTSPFAQQLLDILHSLRVPTWSKVASPSAVAVHKVSGSLTNAVFFVSSPTSRTLLLRIYGPSSGSLISRPRELHTLHVLSATYHMGPRVYGTFDNGRIEEYFDSVALSASEMRDQRTSRFIGARMAELHSVDVAALDDHPSPHRLITAEKNVLSWISPARRVLANPTVPDSARKALDLDTFHQAWSRYVARLKASDKASSGPSVFCHNDAQYGNLLRLHKLKEDVPEHHEIIVVDFEYAGPNPAAFDIANHFHEWTANYHSTTPHLLDSTRYPTPVDRDNFYRAYLSHRQLPLPSGRMTAYLSLPAELQADELSTLEYQVRAWSPMSHAMWAIWGIVQAREDIEAGVAEPEFNYVEYARCRMAGFYDALDALDL
ncbi:kinase-like protein, partial [Amylostereum chailletii]